MTRDMYKFTTHPLLIATESNEYKEQLNDLEFRADNMYAPKLNIIDNAETVAVYKVFLPNK